MCLYIYITNNYIAYLYVYIYIHVYIIYIYTYSYILSVLKIVKYDLFDLFGGRPGKTIVRNRCIIVS